MDDELYPCLSICQTDPQSGLCIACGRPLVVITAELSETAPQDQARGIRAGSENK